ncbi:nucleoside monophosphate kinase [Patescibacteria group bacterium]|nr:nucleoside monophosphate kinase [Patescibacteria group bacterium]MCG2702433.1 nucleoside monophosphate kinase [Candidatus Parcubacteria bacterium]MBU4210327.1 nucleoside monophosphate kinase [Patescibacteria group bacterium]MBU4264517.1 nucleoside monophosphate kinase [Patescibacteria group bacterium]MBU4390448.1 nucleoside monophosphate kinase [Patescibacteria group bacterium]
MPLNLFIIGPSGCGKSTQAQKIAQKYKLTHLSMGQLLRDEIASNTKLGLEAKKTVDNGVWTPAEILYPVLINALNKINNQNFILDGFPRIVDQAVFVDAHLDSLGKSSDLLIHLNVSIEEIIKRRKYYGKKFQKADRNDNTAEAVIQRQKSYNQTINPILEYFQQQNKLFDINGNRPVDPIFADICQKIDLLIKKSIK